MKKAYSQEFGLVMVPNENGLADLLLLKPNIWYRNKIIKPRSQKFHRLVLGNVGHVRNNSMYQGMNEDAFLNFIKLEAAKIGAPTSEFFYDHHGVYSASPKSIAFDNMSQDEFEECWLPIAAILCEIKGYKDIKELYYHSTEDMLQ